MNKILSFFLLAGYFLIAWRLALFGLNRLFLVEFVEVGGPVTVTMYGLEAVLIGAGGALLYEALHGLPRNWRVFVLFIFLWAPVSLILSLAPFLTFIG